MFPVILEEIQRTSCQPREVCVEVAKEYPEPTSQFYLPRCVALHRCGGCCPNEAFYCTNTSHTLVNKTVSGAAGLIYSVFLHVTDFLALYYTIVLVFSPQTAPENRTHTKNPPNSYATRSSLSQPALYCSGPPFGCNWTSSHTYTVTYNFYTLAKTL